MLRADTKLRVDCYAFSAVRHARAHPRSIRGPSLPSHRADPHGFLGGLFIALPILCTNALFEQKGWKYIWINAGYWIVTMTIMGGIISSMP